MREWQKRLPESQKNVLNDIVEQIPTAMGVRDLIEDILDNLARGGPEGFEHTAETAYEIYRIAMESQATAIDDLSDLGPADLHAWGEVAKAMNPQEPAKFKYLIVTDGDVQGTNDREKADAYASSDDNYVLMIPECKWLVDPVTEDDITEL